MKVKQYVIVKVKEDKPFLARVNGVGSDTLEVIPEKGIQLGAKSLTVKKKDVITNLGLSPAPGTVYGCYVTDLYKKTINHSFWGPIHFFTRPDDSDLKMLKKSLDTTAHKLEKLGLADFTSLIETEIRAKKGKYAGLYRHSGKTESVGTIVYAPEFASGDQSAMDYVIYHEFGHAIRHNGVQRVKLRSKWLSLYQKSIANIKITDKELKRIFKDIRGFSEQDSSFSEAFRGATEELNPRVGKGIMAWFKETHKLHGKELELLWQSGNVDELEAFWPDHLIDTHDLKPIVSDYATVNVEELFAESFAFYAQGKKLPNRVVELMETSLSIAKQTIRDHGN